MKPLFSAFFLWVLVIVSCHSPKQAAAAETLLQKKWYLVELNSMPVRIDKDTAYLLLADNKVTGNTGCNHLSGSYEMSADTKKLHFSPLITTKMACPGDSVEAELLAVLAKVDGYSIDGSSLMLNEGQDNLARFEAFDNR